MTSTPTASTDADSHRMPPVAPGLVVEVSAHRGLRGPYTAGAALLRVVVSEVAADDPLLLRRYAVAVVALAPDLERLVPDPPHTLTNTAQGSERTRFYSVERTRDLAFSVSQLVREWASRWHPDGVRLVVRDLDEADHTDTQLVEMLTRRCGGSVVEVVTHREGDVDVAPSDADAAQRWVDADGTSTDPDARTAYDGLSEQERARRHAARARLLIERAAPGDAWGAVLHHLERGPDAARVASAALWAAHQDCFNRGFYHYALELAQRALALTDRATDPYLWGRLGLRSIGALAYLERPLEAMALVHELRRTSVDRNEHMHLSYLLAMLYTRHLDPQDKDNDLALEFGNTAIALADADPDPDQRAFFGAFMRNAKALVALHRRDLTGALALVDEAMAVADSHLAPDAHQLHRSVLVNNRARVLAGLGRLDEARSAFDEVVRRDPDYDEPYFDRAAVHRGLGDLEAAVADLGHAIELSAAFAEAYYNRADILVELGDTDAALLDYAVVLEIDPDHVPTRLNRAAIRLGGGDPAGAAADLDHALALDPAQASLWSARALVHAELDEHDAALSAYGRAISLAPDEIGAWVNRGVLRYSLGQLPESLADLTEALALDDGSVLRLNRAVALQELGDHEAAVEDLERALELATSGGVVRSDDRSAGDAAEGSDADGPGDPADELLDEIRRRRLTSLAALAAAEVRTGASS